DTGSHAPGSIDTSGDEVDEDDEQPDSDDSDDEEDEADEDETEQDESKVRLGPDGKPILPPGTDEPGLVESIVLVSANPISAGKIARTLSSEGFTPGKVKAIVGHLNECYATEGRAFRIQEIAGGYQFYTLAPYADVLTRLVKAPTEISLSQAALEVLAIVAYKQPIIRADIEAIRGVSCGPLLRHLLEINLVRIVGKSDQLGRPLLYGTTKKFLEHFGLGDLKDLPKSGTLSQPG
ncbi:MAG: SMC-Scp complex subunit ScpB, partial [Planctomycetota bacterium]